MFRMKIWNCVRVWRRTGEVLDLFFKCFVTVGIEFYPTKKKRVIGCLLQRISVHGVVLLGSTKRYDACRVSRHVRKQYNKNIPIWNVTIACFIDRYVNTNPNISECNVSNTSSTRADKCTIPESSQCSIQKILWKDFSREIDWRILGNEPSVVLDLDVEFSGHLAE